jgi:hypothetical protein
LGVRTTCSIQISRFQFDCGTIREQDLAAGRLILVRQDRGRRSCSNNDRGQGSNHTRN